MKTKPLQKEKTFWNKAENVTYFANKAADWRVESRLKEVRNRNGKKALDLGCGGGRHTEMLCRLGFEVHACDVNPEMISATKHRIELAGLSDQCKEIVFGCIEKVPYSNEMFEVVVTTGVLHQAKSVNDYELAISELARVSKLGGVVCLNIFTNRQLDPTLKSVSGKEFTYITKEGLWMTLLPKNRFFSMMEKHGLTLETEISEDLKIENTGPRTVLRANFIKDN